MKSRAQAGYNERLFAGGLRCWLHTARFRWLRRAMRRRGDRPGAVLELGCFDGKLVDHLEHPPARYLGIDAGWEGGLDAARTRFAGVPGFDFIQARSPAEAVLPDGEAFDAGIAMETLEHVPPEMVAPYLDFLARHVRGRLYITVPNEIGPVFLAKWIAKRLSSEDAEPHTPAELLNAFLGRADRIARREHKGFDYRVLVRQVSRRCRVEEVSGHPLGWLPPWLCFGVGIVARPRRVRRRRTDPAGRR